MSAVLSTMSPLARQATEQLLGLAQTPAHFRSYSPDASLVSALLEIGEAWRSPTQSRALILGLRGARDLVADPRSGGTLAGALAALRSAS